MTEARDHGPQPIGELLTQHALNAQDLVAVSDEQITHKMIARATKGRQLTPRVMGKILRALNLATGESYELADLFDYAPRPGSRLEQRMPEECATSTDREASYTCPNCGETIVVPVDIDARIQEYVEDCPVCCSPVLLRLEISEDGDVRIAAQAE